ISRTPIQSQRAARAEPFISRETIGVPPDATEPQPLAPSPDFTQRRKGAQRREEEKECANEILGSCRLRVTRISRRDARKKRKGSHEFLASRLLCVSAPLCVSA